MGALIRIVAGIVTDVGGRTLLVRKRGTRAFMQPGGKLVGDETPLDALGREFKEELGCAMDSTTAVHIGRFQAPAANEPDALVDADLFECRLTGAPSACAEIEELLWLDLTTIGGVQLAPLTAHVVLPYVARRATRSRP